MRWARTLIGRTIAVLAGSVAAALVVAATAPSAGVPSGFIDTLVAPGLTAPTAMAFDPKGRLFVAEQGGDLRVVQDGVLRKTPFAHLSVDSSGERGLLGVAFDPAWTSNHYVYVYSTVPGSPAHNRVTRFTADASANYLVAVANSQKTILDLDPLSSATNHNGGAIHFGPDGKLYVAVGENANGANAQDKTNLLGKVLRINGDGTIPTDNPFYGSTTGNNRAIWALGFRNPYTFAFQPGGSRMYINDVGQSTFEEIDAGRAGRNYGWPFCEGPCTGYTNPVTYYAHNGDPQPNGCAIVGAAFYNPPVAYFPSTYVGKYFFSDLCGGWIYWIAPGSPGTHTKFATGISAPVDLQVGPDGSLYYLERGTGSVRRISFQKAPTITGMSPTSGAAGSARVALFGSYLAGTTKVTLNGQSVPFTVLNDTEVKFRVPNGAAAGSLPVTLTTAAGTVASPTNFTVNYTITGFSPTSGPVGTTVTIRGAGFTNPSSVTFRGIASGNVTFVSPSQLEATVPSGATTGRISVIRNVAPTTTQSATNFSVTP